MLKCRGKTWVISVWRGGGDNLEIARKQGVWGAKGPSKLAGVEPGDRVLFVFKLRFKPGTKTSRVPAGQYRLIADRAALVIHGVAESGLYEEAAPVWPDDVYPHRFRFRESAAQSDVLVVDAFPPDVVEAIRLSMMSAGKAYSVQGSTDPPVSKLNPSPPVQPTGTGTAKPTEVGDDIAVPEPEVVDPTGALDVGHTQAQWQLAQLGRALRMDVWVPRPDRHKTYEGQQLGDLSVAALPTLGFTTNALEVVQNIVILWIHRGVVACAFEVEHTTAVFSGILRMSDLAIEQPYARIKLFIVATERRREKVRKELRRPTFRQAGLGQQCQFLSYERLDERLKFAQEHGSYLSVLEWIERLGEPIDSA